MARPTKYNQDILEKTKDYLINHENYGDVIPSNAGLSLVLDITRETINQWSKDEEKKAFSDTLAKIKQKQENLLISKGLTGDFNSTITKLILTNHGYSDRKEISGPEGGPIEVDTVWQVEFINASPED